MRRGKGPGELETKNRRMKIDRFKRPWEKAATGRPRRKEVS